jgi:hypothetical protein
MGYYVYDSLDVWANHSPISLSEAKRLAMERAIAYEGSFKIRNTRGKLIVTYKYGKSKRRFLK